MDNWISQIYIQWVLLTFEDVTPSTYSLLLALIIKISSHRHYRYLWSEGILQGGWTASSRCGGTPSKHLPPPCLAGSKSKVRFCTAMHCNALHWGAPYSGVEVGSDIFTVALHWTKVHWYRCSNGHCSASWVCEWWVSLGCIHCTSNPPWKEASKKTEGDADNDDDEDIDFDDDNDDQDDDTDDDLKQWPLYPLSRLWNPISCRLPRGESYNDTDFLRYKQQQKRRRQKRGEILTS